MNVPPPTPAQRKFSPDHTNQDPPFYTPTLIPPYGEVVKTNAIEHVEDQPYPVEKNKQERKQDDPRSKSTHIRRERILEGTRITDEVKKYGIEQNSRE